MSCLPWKSTFYREKVKFCRAKVSFAGKSMFYGKKVKFCRGKVCFAGGKYVLQ